MENKSFETIEFFVKDRVATVLLNRPKALNALDAKTCSELTNAFELCNDKEVKVVVLSGKGKAFSAGGDIKMMTELDSTTPNGLKDLLENVNRLIINMRNLEKPIVALINGFTMGAGFSIALACDFRIAAKSSAFGCAFVNIGLVPDSGASFFLTKLIGAAKATELLMLGDTINSDQAFSLGLLNRVVPDDELAVVGQKFARELSQKPSEAVARIKRLVNRAIISDLSDQIALETMFQGEVAKTSDFKEGITAFVEKRKPNFK